MADEIIAVITVVWIKFEYKNLWKCYVKEASLFSFSSKIVLQQMAPLFYSFKLICSALGTVDKCGHHNFCVILYGDASGSERTHFTINQSYSNSCVSSCYRKACRQRRTSSYPHTWSWEQQTCVYVCSFVCEYVCGTLADSQLHIP